MPTILKDLVETQLSSILRLSSLPGDCERRVLNAFNLFTSESLDQPIGDSFPGLSRINADGLPFQWVLHLDQLATRFGFLCESGRPGDHPYVRFIHSRSRLALICGFDVCQQSWLDCIANVLIPYSRESWPPHWRSALWLGVVASGRDVLLKPYFNLNVGTARDRWLRAGRVLQVLNRYHSLSALCDLSAKVSWSSWPVGLMIDVLPCGSPGRVKLYFRSEAVTLNWLDRWYESTGQTEHTALARRFLDLFPFLRQLRYPSAAFTVALEFHPGSRSPGLKTDLAVTKWMHSDAEVRRGVKALVSQIGSCPDQLDQYLCAVGAIPVDSDRTRSFRFVGLGHEPNGQSHINVYVEPRLPLKRTSVRGQRLSIGDAVRAAASFLITGQRDEFWIDFDLPVGSSTMWVTAYTLARLAQVPHGLLPPAGSALIAKSLAWLLRVRSTTGGWGYNSAVSNDADSTAWSILALRRNHWAVPSMAAAYLARCRHPSGGFTTYPIGDSTADLWLAVAPDVSAAAMQALEEPWSAAAEAFFLRRTDEPPLPAYWWASRFYTLAILIETYPELPSTSSIRCVVDSLKNVAAATSFDAALLLTSLVAVHRSRACGIARDLCRQQRPDGSWPPSALLRLPKPENATPWRSLATEPLYTDQNAIFTTATSMAALSRLIRAPAEM